MCIGTERAEQIFVFDVLALEPFKSHLQSLFRILTNPAVKKAMWDCRNDFLEIQNEYNVMMTGTVDLQLAEAQARTTVKREGDYQHKCRFTRGGCSAPLQTINQNAELFFEVHRLQGMDACIRQAGLLTAGKDHTCSYGLRKHLVLTQRFIYPFASRSRRHAQSRRFFHMDESTSST